MLTVIANYECCCGAGEEVEAVLRNHAAATGRERGCISFAAYRNAEQPDRFVLVEQYVDEAALREHRQTPHFKQFIEDQILPLLVERTWRRYVEITEAAAQ